MRTIYIHYNYIQTVDTYMTAVFINIYIIMVNVGRTALACFDGYVRAANLIADRLRITLTLIIDSCY